LCRFWKISRQAYYKGRKEIVEMEEKNIMILSKVKGVRKKHPQLGTLKLRKELDSEIRDCGRGFGRDKFFDLLRDHGLLIKRKPRFAITTNSDHPFYKYKNRLAVATITAPDQAWVSDITYLRTRQNFVYLSLITDIYSRKIVGWNVDVSLGVEGSIKAVNKAISQCRQTENIIHHSDRGIQYCCHAYTDLMRKNGIKISMGESGNCYDNAIAERVNGILKNEYLLDNEFKDYQQAVKAVKEAVYLYNYERPHWSLNLQKPANVHENKVKEAK
jgi:putative transposase